MFKKCVKAEGKQFDHLKSKYNFSIVCCLIILYVLDGLKSILLYNKTTRFYYVVCIFRCSLGGKKLVSMVKCSKQSEFWTYKCIGE